MAKPDFWRKMFFQLSQSKLSLSLICKNSLLQSVWSIFSFGNKLCLSALCSVPKIPVDTSIVWNAQKSRLLPQSPPHVITSSIWPSSYHTHLYPALQSPRQIFSIYHSVPLQEWPGNLQQPHLSTLFPLLTARTVCKHIPSLFPQPDPHLTHTQLFREVHPPPATQPHGCLGLEHPSEGL